MLGGAVMIWVLGLLACGGTQPPQAGMWLYDSESIVFSEDSCGLQLGMVFVDAIIDQVDAPSFRYIDTNGDADTCLASGGGYTCDAREQDVPAGSATLTFVSNHTGTFTDDSTLSRTLSITGECAGDDCASQFGSVSFPCSTTASMTAVYDGPADALDTGYVD